MKKYILNYQKYMISESAELLNNNQNDENLVPLYFSKKLLSILKKIESDPISKKLLESLDGLFPLSYLDVHEDSKNISYFPTERLNRITIDIDQEPEPIHEVWTSKLRQFMTIGKMINKLFPNQFSNMDIDQFYNRYRPQLDVKDDSRFKIVRGDEIKYWYLNSRWDGSLTSCMKGESCQKYFDIYTNNPEKCGLLIYFSEKDPKKIVGRALIWNDLIKPKPAQPAEPDQNYTLMDRVYATDNDNNKITQAFQKYAIDHGFLYKVGDQFLLNGKRISSSVTTRLKPIDYKYYPYVDTMCYYTPETGRASFSPGKPGRDKNDPSKVFKRYQLRSQDGSYTLVGKDVY